jgi:hypothetical protein
MNIRDRLGVPSNKVLNLIQQKAKSESEGRPLVGEKSDRDRMVYVPTAKKPDPALQENSKALVNHLYQLL